MKIAPYTHHAAPYMCPSSLFLSINSSMLSSTSSVNTFSDNSFIRHGNVPLLHLFHVSSTITSHQLSVFFKTQQFHRHSNSCCHAVFKQHKPGVTLVWLSQTDPFLAFVIHLLLIAWILQLVSSSMRCLFTSVWFNPCVLESVLRPP